MPTAELIVIIITGAVSILDVFVNVFTLCMHGRCTSRCGCCSIEHTEDEDKKHELVVSDSIRKMFTKTSPVSTTI
jgi:hypothetical protein